MYFVWQERIVAHIGSHMKYSKARFLLGKNSTTYAETGGAATPNMLSRSRTASMQCVGLHLPLCFIGLVIAKMGIPATKRTPISAEEQTRSFIVEHVDARSMLDKNISEKEFQVQVIQLAKLNGFLCHHQLVPFRISRDGKPRAITEENTDPGIPDLILVRGHHVLYRELKTMKGKCSPDQERWAKALHRAGADYDLWRPSDWDEIVLTLTTLT